MKPVVRLLTGVLLAGLLVLGGCGKKEEQPTRFNRTLGGTPVGVPTGTVQINTGILQDPTAYKPHDYEPLEGAAPGGGAAGGPEVAAIQAVLKDLVSAIFEPDIDTILDSFVPEQVAVLRQDDYMSTFYETKDTFDAFSAVMEAKATGPEFESSAKLAELLPQLTDPLLNAITTTVQDDENAVATLDLGKIELPAEIQSELTKAFELGASMGQMGAPGAVPAVPTGGPPPIEPDPNVPGATPGAPPSPGTPAAGFSWEMLQENLVGVQIPLPLRKIGDEWKLVLPFAFQEEHAELINDGLLLLKDIAADLTQKIDAVETLDAQTYAQIAMQTQMSNMGAIMGFVARAQAMIASIMEAPAGATEEAAAEEPAEPQEPNAAQGPNAPESPPPGRGRTP